MQVGSPASAFQPFSSFVSGVALEHVLFLEINILEFLACTAYGVSVRPRVLYKGEAVS